MGNGAVSKARTRKTLIYCLGLALVLSGCQRKFLIDKSELVKLDGFRADDEVTLVDRDGKEVTFTENMLIRFTFLDGRTFALHYSSIDLRQGVFVGKTAPKLGGAVVKADLVEIGKVTLVSPGVWLFREHPPHLSRDQSITALITALVVIGALVWLWLVLGMQSAHS